MAPGLALVGDLTGEPDIGITSTRLWHVVKRFFTLAADVIGEDHPSAADKRHASVSTTSVYLHSDEVKRARQIGEAFGA